MNGTQMKKAKMKMSQLGKSLLMLSAGLVSGLFLTSCNEDDATTLTSPVQAVTTVFEMPNGLVKADLYLISTTDSEDHVFVNDAEKVMVRIPGGAEVDLKSKGSGRYSRNSNKDNQLLYLPGETYQFRFELDGDSAGDVAGGSFIAVVDAPEDEAIFFDYYDEPDFDGDDSTFNWAPASLRGIFTVRDESGDIVYTNFDFTNPTFSGDKWASLFANGKAKLGVDVYPEAGTYLLEFCAVNSQQGFDNELSAELGVLSGFLIGRCVKSEVVVAD